MGAEVHLKLWWRCEESDCVRDLLAFCSISNLWEVLAQALDPFLLACKWQPSMGTYKVCFVVRLWSVIRSDFTVHKYNNTF